MSGDVQPRKRKDKKRKRDDRKSEGEVIFSRKQSLQDEDESSHGVHITKMGNEDVHLHVQQEHGTGGHWCAKVIFFALMAVLLSLVGLIILENRGLADLDTPLSESRFSNYFDGWVEERREEHDEHDAVQASLEEHDEHDEPFEEEEDHSEVDEDNDHDEHDDDEEDEDHDDDDEEDDDDDENVTEEATAEVSKENDDDDDDDDKDDNDDNDDNATKEDDDDDDEVENVTQSVEDYEDDDEDVTQTAEEEDDDDADNTAEDNNDDDDDDDEDNDVDNDNDEDEDNTKEQTAEASDELNNDNDDDNSQDNDDNNDDDDDNDEVNETVESRQQTSNSQQSKADNDDDDDDDDPFDEEDDDGTFESLENVVVDNDAEELLLLQEKARRQAAESGKATNADDDDNDDANDDDAAEAAPSWASSLAVKIGVGVALALVARFVLIRKNPNTIEEPSAEVLMKRRLTIASAEEPLPEDEEVAPPLSEYEIKPKQKPTGGPQANDDEMEVLFEQELRRATEEMLRENYANALQKYSLLTQKHPDRPAPFLGQAQCLDELSQQRRSNQLLHDALEAFKRYLAFDEMVPDAQQFRQAAERCIERMSFMGYHNQAVPIHQQLIAHFRHDVELRNQLAVTYLTINRLAEAKQLLQETLQRWPANGFALVHYGFVLKNLDQDYATAAAYLQKGIDTQAPGTKDGRFYFNLGDAYQRLGRAADALQTYKSGAALRLFPSAYQRSLYNVPQLRAQPYWTLAQTTYAASLEKFEHNWQAIRDEALSLLSRSTDGVEYFQNESENLRDTGHWQQYELWARGQRNTRNCLKAPITCGLVQQFAAAATCRRGQVKFSLMQPETHVWPHCGPTNCRLRAHLGLLVPPGTRLRVADEESTWTEGKFLIFDDSFEHEVWHEGSAGPRLVLIVDVWHPDLTEQQRQSLTPI